MSGAGGGPVYYKPWTMGNMKFPGLGGHTIAIDFTTNDCGFSGHFGYGYVDMSCGLFMNEIITCAGTVSLSGPDGYQSYVWKDSATFSTTYGTSQLVVVTTPTVATTYAVIVTPYVGYGCVDTLYTRVIVPAPITGPGTVCIGGTATMTNPVPGGAWTSGSTGIAIIGGSSGIITGMAAGTTTITYTIGGTCVSTMAVTVTPCPSLSAPFSNKDEALTIFPNPNKGELMVNLSSAINATAIITITNLIGVKVDEFRINTNENTRLKIAYPAGIYILSTNTSQGRLVERLVIME
jgi:ribosomal protein S8